jgi:hypothetical protein
MSTMMMLWAAIGLSVLGAIVMWFGMFNSEIVLYIGLAIFSIGMLIGPLTRFVGEEED